MWRRRGIVHGVRDPWISILDHGQVPYTVIYGGEGGSSHMHEYLLNHNGTDVYIR